MRRALASIGANEVNDAVRAVKELFFNARTHRHWLPHEVSDHTLRSLYEAVRLGPTSCNSSPDRFVFVKSREQDRTEVKVPATIVGLCDADALAGEG